jgi:CRISPR-associated protein Csd1
MTWSQQLFEVYDRLKDSTQTKKNILPPIHHTIVNADIEVVLDKESNFVRASIVPKEDANTLIQCTQKSIARTGDSSPHPLCDGLKYVAGDLSKFIKIKNCFFEEYLKLLSSWCSSKFSCDKIYIIKEYVEKKSLIQDLLNCKILVLKDNDLAHVSDEKKKQGFVRWSIESDSDLIPEVWKDKSIQESWINFCTETCQELPFDFCSISGKKDIVMIRSPKDKDGTKLISYREGDDFTFRNRFKSPHDSSLISIESAYKIYHSRLWLEKNQSFRQGTLSIITWSKKDSDILDVLFSSLDSKLIQDEEKSVYLGKNIAKELSKKIQGYKSTVDTDETIVTMMTDSSSIGRKSIIFYSELLGSKLLERIENWHKESTWYQCYYDVKLKKHIRWIGCPSLREIAYAVNYRSKKDSKALSRVLRRLFPCIINGEKIPYDIVKNLVELAKKQDILPRYDQEKILGIACAVYKKFYSERRYKMDLEEARISRDYLYGRLLAVAEMLESRYFYEKGISRTPKAITLFQLFSKQPYRTWLRLEENLSLSRTELQNTTTYDKILDEITSKFTREDFILNKPLEGEFLLGYHCQKQEIWNLLTKSEEIKSEKIKEECND